MVEEAFSGWQQRHPSRSASEERRSELVLERPDLTANRWLGDVEALCRASDVSCFRDGDEVADLNEAHVMSMAFAPKNRKRRRQIEKVLDSAHALPA